MSTIAGCICGLMDSLVNAGQLRFWDTNPELSSREYPAGVQRAGRQAADEGQGQQTEPAQLAPTQVPGPEVLLERRGNYAPTCFPTDAFGAPAAAAAASWQCLGSRTSCVRIARHR